jgi:hypothetical protein
MRRAGRPAQLSPVLSAVIGPEVVVDNVDNMAGDQVVQVRDNEARVVASEVGDVEAESPQPGTDGLLPGAVGSLLLPDQAAELLDLCACKP